MSLERKRLQVDLLKMKAALAELEYTLDTKLLEIERIKNHIATQELKIEEKEKELLTNKEG